MSQEPWDKGIAKKLYSEEEIANRITELGAQITKDYSDVKEEIIIVCLLKGSVIFMADLCREIKIPIKMDFMVVSSYGNELVSTREVKILKDLDENIMGKHIIVVEDIIDSGNTLKTILKMLGHRGAKSVSLCSMLNKPSRREVEVDIQYIGFEIGDEFVIGYGLDYMQEYRNIPYIGVIGEDSIKAL